MSNKDKNGQFESAAKQNKSDVLRAIDIIPASANKSDKKSKLQALRPAGQRQEIPKFDLAEEIMAEQRKTVAEKRKGPGRESETKSRQSEDKQPDYAMKKPFPVPLQQEQIISEIVTRDIEMLYRGIKHALVVSSGTGSITQD